MTLEKVSTNDVETDGRLIASFKLEFDADGNLAAELNAPAPADYRAAAIVVLANQLDEIGPNAIGAVAAEFAGVSLETYLKWDDNNDPRADEPMRKASVRIAELLNQLKS